MEMIIIFLIGRIDMKRAAFIFVFLLIFCSEVVGEEFIGLWPDGKMPNSKGIKLEEVIVNDRIRQVDRPDMYAFFPAKEENTGCAVLICPGGGYHHLAYDVSGFAIAKWFNTIGASAFVLKYRLPDSPDLVEPDKGPLQDAQRAMRLIRSRAKEWGIDPEKIGVMGTSAGGHLASTLGTHSEDVSSIGDSADTMSFRPGFMILVSPVITMGDYTEKGTRENLLGDNPSDELIQKYSNEQQVTSETAVSFIVHAADDSVVDVRNSIMFFEALSDKKVSASLHIFPQGDHSIGVCKNPGSTALWTSLCEEWLREKNFI
jgi:acetyl esterase/lipase